MQFHRLRNLIDYRFERLDQCILTFECPPTKNLPTDKILFGFFSGQVAADLLPPAKASPSVVWTASAQRLSQRKDALLHIRSKPKYSDSYPARTCFPEYVPYPYEMEIDTGKCWFYRDLEWGRDQ